MSPNLVGALLMMASMAFFTLNDTFVKATDGAVPLFQLLFLRGLLATVLILIMTWARGALRLNFPARDWWLIGLRSFGEVGAAYFFITALFHMPLANISAILQATPLAVTLGSALVFREPVGWRRMSAIVVGFFGMLLIVRPGPEGFSLWSVYALLSVVFVVVRDLASRRLSRDVPSLMVTLSASAAVMVCAGLGALTEPWVPVTPDQSALIVGAGIFVVGGYYFSVQVMRAGDVAFIAPFRYTSLLWALVLGWLVFGQWPSALTLLGAAIIVATGLFTLYRERKLLKH